jgi:hypothetical protein
MLLDVENQITDFLKAFLYFNDAASGLCMVSFSAGLLINIAAQYGQRAFGDSEMNGLQQALFVLWIISSIQLLAIATIKPSEFYTCVRYEPGSITESRTAAVQWRIQKQREHTPKTENFLRKMHVVTHS